MAALSAALSSTQDAFFIIRIADEMLLDCNKAFITLSGYDRDQVMGSTVSDLGLFQAPGQHDQILNLSAAQDGDAPQKLTLYTANNALIPIDLSVHYARLDQGWCALCIGHSVPEKTLPADDSEQATSMFMAFFNQISDPVALIRADDGIVTNANNALLSRSGYQLEEIVGLCMFDHPVLFDNQDIKAIATETAPGAAAEHREVQLTTKQGEKSRGLLSTSFFTLSGEKYLMMTAKDLSQEDRAEERLRSSEARFRGIFENAPFGILLVDLYGSIFQVNSSAATLLGYQQTNMHGLNLSSILESTEQQGLKTTLGALNKNDVVSETTERRLVCHDGQIIWANFHITLQRNRAGDPVYYIVQISDLTDIKRNQQRIERMAFYDTLTDLANRRLFHDRLETAIQKAELNGRCGALLYLDLDNFKRVNDTLGHQVGDQLLREIALRLERCVRSEDTVSRTGGDEFSILLETINAPADAANVAQKVIEQLSQPVFISGHPLVVSTSIGITILPTDSTDPNELMRNADLAMYKAKDNGRKNYQFYSQDLNVNAVRKLRTEYELRQALQRKEFELFFQPIIAIPDSRVVGVECLLRWNHPERGLLGPDQFIDVAEETGVIIDIGTWVIEEACRATQLITDHINRPLNVSINISPQQFRDPNLLNTMRRSLLNTGVKPNTIEIEITETALIQDLEGARGRLKELAALGTRIAIDDFGTGYSSLNYLKRFPINTVKIDRSFVKDLPDNSDDMAIARAVIAMSHQLKMQVVAEGVETAEQLEFLAEEGCEFAQGWLFSKAEPLDRLFELLTFPDDGGIRKTG